MRSRGMSSSAFEAANEWKSTFPLRFRLRIVLYISATIAVLLASISVLLFSKAVSEQHAIKQKISGAADAVSSALDLEVHAAEHLLRGLATSPALQSGDINSFHQQLLRAPVSEGTWFTLMDKQRYLVSTFKDGGPLIATSPQILAILHDKEFNVSGRFYGPLAKAELVGVQLVIRHDSGDIKYILHHTLSGQRLENIVKRPLIPPGWFTVVLDRNKKPIVDTRIEFSFLPAVISEFGGQISVSRSGFFQSKTFTGALSYLAYIRSESTGWTVVTGVPAAIIAAPWNEATRNLFWWALALVSLGLIGSLATARGLEGPIRLLRKSASDAKDQLRSTEAQLHAAETLYQTYWEHSAEALYVIRVTDSGRFEYMRINPALERLSGIRDLDVRGKSPHECLPAEAADIVTAHYRECIESGNPIRYEQILELPGGKRHWASQLAPVRDPESGRVTLLLGGCRDITHLRATEENVKATNRRMRSILASISDCYCTIGRDMVVTDINEAALKWAGMSRDAVVGKSCLDHSEKFPFPPRILQDALKGTGAIHLEVPSSVRPGRWLDFHIYPSADGLSIFFRDISERKQAQQSVVASESLLRSTLNAMPGCVLLLDEQGVILRANKAWCRMMEQSGNRTLQGGVGSPYFSLNPLNFINRVEIARLESKLRAVMDEVGIGFQVTCEAGQKNSSRWYQVNVARFHVDGRARIVVVHEDVTRAHLAQTEIHDLSEMLLKLQEEERQRIAIELHDSTSQHLTAAGLNLMALRRKSGGNGSSRFFDDIEHSLDEAQKEIRVISYLLYPPNLEREGLKATLNRYVDGFSSRTGLKASMEVSRFVETISIEMQRAVLRIVQEALSNVHRHANASEVGITLQLKKKHLMIRIADDGRGLGNGKDNAAQLGVGVPGMRTRVKQFGGQLRISGRDGGTKIYACIPLAKMPRETKKEPAAATGQRPGKPHRASGGVRSGFESLPRVRETKERQLAPRK